MIRISVIHNNEQDRLQYLVPKVEELVSDLIKRGHAASFSLVGPDTDLVRSKSTSHNWYTRTIRAFYATQMFSAAVKDTPNSQGAKGFISFWFKTFIDQLFKFRRSVRIEQEVHFAHVSALLQASENNEFALTLESDAIVNSCAIEGLSALIDYIQEEGVEGKRIFVDLAGGCDRSKIIGHWCFEDLHRIDISLNSAPWLTVHKLPRIVGNTVGGYLVSPTLAKDLAEFALNTRTYCPFDWVVNLFGARSENKRDFICIHTTPMLFEQGSTSGHYLSTGDPWVRM